jgi:mRNA-degrading endonuclease RelE of RelBE toxin-antitoxin system
MTDRLTKFLDKLTAKEKKRIASVLSLIERGRFDGMDVKKLQGHENIYRVRKGDIRIIIFKADFETYILAIERRSDTTYSF